MSRKDDRIDALVRQNEQLIESLSGARREIVAKDERIKELTNALRQSRRELTTGLREASSLTRLFLHGEKRIARIQADYEREAEQYRQTINTLRGWLAKAGVEQSLIDGQPRTTAQRTKKAADAAQVDGGASAAGNDTLPNADAPSL